MSEKILAALRQLDPGNDNHWTEDGMPRMDTVKFMSGDSTLTREAVSNALPGFSRGTAAEKLADKGAGTETATTPATQPQTQAGGPDTAQQTHTPSGDGHGAEQKVDGGAETNPEADSQPQSYVNFWGKPESRQHAEKQLERLLEAKAELDAQLAKTTAALDEFLAAEAVVTANQPISTVIGGYLQSQQKLRDERAARLEAMKGIKLSDVLPTRAKIDDAFQRRTARGTKRPSTL